MRIGRKIDVTHHVARRAVEHLLIKNGPYQALSAGINPNFIAAQMGHASAQMVYNVYGKWMNDNNGDQMSILNENFSDYAPYMPPAKNQ